MSLRDQLLKAGVVSKKKVRETNRALKRSRKQKQASRDGKKEIAAKSRAERRAAEKARVAAQQEARRVRMAEREAREAKRLVRNLLRTYRVPERGGDQLFFHKAAQGPGVIKCLLPWSVAHDLRRGAMAVAWDGDDPAAPEYVLLPAAAAARVAAAQPARVVFFNTAAPSDEELDDQLYDMGAIARSRERVTDRWAGLR